MDDLGLAKQLDRCFSSHLIGTVKPDAAGFRFVVDSLATPAAQILFFDDMLLNVEAARNIGMQAKQVVGFEQLRVASRAIGLA